MHNFQHIVDEVRNSLAIASPEMVDALRTAAADYIAACNEANQRLLECGDRLHKGLRSEAIQLADVEPKLLDVLNVLDFPELDRWRETSADLGLPPPPMLHLDIAAELNEALALEQPLADLLRQHRLLALARSPLKQRISTLRELAQADPSNSVWRDDLRVFEQERWRQIQGEVSQAANAQNLEQLAALEQELQSTPWCDPPSPALVKLVVTTLQAQDRKQRLRSLEQAADRLNEAFTHRDLALGRQLREAWHAGVKSLELAESGELQERAAAALNWLREQDSAQVREQQRRAALDELEQALNDAPLSRLEPLYRAALKRGRGLPEELELRCRQRVAALRRARIRKRVLLWGSLAAALALVVTAAAMRIQFARRQADLENATAALHGFMQEGKLDLAQDYLQDLQAVHPQLLQSPQLARLADRLREAADEETLRSAAFAKALAAAQAGGAQQHDPAALAQAQRSARTIEEKADVARFSEQVAAWQTQESQRLDRTFSQDLQPVIDQLDQLVRNPPETAQELERAILRIRTEAKAVEQRHGQARQAAQAQLQPFWSRLESLTARGVQMREEEVLLAEICRSVGDVPRFSAALAKYVQQWPGETRSLHFQQALDESPLWASVAPWSELIRGQPAGEKATLDPPLAAKLAERTINLLAQHPDLPWAGEFRNRLPYWQAIGRREKDGQSIAGDLEREFKNPLVSNVWMLETNDRRRFYLKAQPEINREKLNTISYFATKDLLEKPISIAGQKIVFNDRAPQVAVADAARKLLGQLNDDNWEATFHKLLVTIEASQKTDPLLKLDLIQRTLAVGCEGSASLAKVYARQAAVLKEGPPSFLTNWVDPNDPLANQRRDEAARLLKEFAEAPELESALRADAEAARRPLGKNLAWLGLLLRRGERWECLKNAASTETGELYVVRRAVAGEPALLERIGTIARGVAEIKPGSALAAAFLEGRPVFVLRTVN